VEALDDEVDGFSGHQQKERFPGCEGPDSQGDRSLTGLQVARHSLDPELSVPIQGDLLNTDRSREVFPGGTICRTFKKFARYSGKAWCDTEGRHEARPEKEDKRWKEGFFDHGPIMESGRQKAIIESFSGHFRVLKKP